MDVETNTQDTRESLNEITAKLSLIKFPWLYWWLLFFVFLVLAFLPIKELISKSGDDHEKLYYVSMILFSCAFYSTLFVGGRHWFKKNKLEKSRHDLLVKYLAEETNSLQNDLDENFFTNLIKINFKYLDKYYLQTQIQADKSFKLTAFAAMSGLIVIIIGLILLFFNKNEVGYVTTATGVIGEFIASVFFYLYNNTVSKMSDYHQKLVLTQNVSLALKIADDLPETEQASAKVNLVEYLSKDVNKLLANSQSIE